MKKYKKYIWAFAVLLAAAVLTVLPFLLEKRPSSSEEEAVILSGITETGKLQKNLSGAGTLIAQDAESLTLPEGVTVIGYLAENGDLVEAGEPLALVDRNSVLMTIRSIKETMEELEASMMEVAGDTVSSSLSDLTGFSGTGEYEALANRHRIYEDMLERLFRMFNDGTLNSPCDGQVSDIDEEAASLLHFSADYGCRVVLLADPESIPPSGEEPETEGNSVIGSVIMLKEDGTVVICLIFAGEPVFITLDPLSYAVDPDKIKAGSSLILTYEPEATDPNLPVSAVLVEAEPEEKPVQPQSGGGMMSGGFSSSETEEETLFPTEESLLLSVTPLETMTVSVTVDELDLLSIHTGDAAVLTIDALPGRSFDGTLTAINTAANNNGGNSKFTAEITLTRDENMLPGMNVSSLIVTEEKKDVLCIPVEALSEENGKTYVYTGYDEKNLLLISPVEVQIGLSDGLQAEILSGLEEGQKYWYSYYENRSGDLYESINRGGRENTGGFSVPAAEGKRL